MDRPNQPFGIMYKKPRFSIPLGPNPVRGSPKFLVQHNELEAKASAIDLVIIPLIAQAKAGLSQPAAHHIHNTINEALPWVVRRAEPSSKITAGLVRFDLMLDRMVILMFEFSPVWSNVNLPTKEQLYSVNPAAYPASPFLGLYIINGFVDGLEISGVSDKMQLVMVVNDCTI